MDTITLPLLVYALQEQTVLGLLLGTNIQQVGSDENTIKAAMTDYLDNQYKKYNDYPQLDITQPRLKTVTIKIRPTHRRYGHLTPATKALEIPLSLVYAKDKSGNYTCFFPIIEESFNCQNAKEIDHLAREVGWKALSDMSPKRLFQLKSYPKPKLTEIQLRVKKEKPQRWKAFQQQQRTYELLNRIATPYPASKKLRKAQQLFPDIAWCREQEAEQIIHQVITMRANVLIVGAPSTGKSTLLKMALKKIDTQTTKDKIDWNCWQMYPEQLLNSGKYFGQWQENCEKLMEELRSDNAILWVEKFIDLLRYGGETPQSSMAAFLLPFLQQNKLQIVGELLPSEFERLSTQLPAFAHQFKVIHIDEMSEETTLQVLQHLADYSSQQLQVKVSQTALQNIIYLQQRFIPYAHFPGKAVRLLSHLITNAKTQKKKQVNRPDVVSIFSQQTGLPELFLKDGLQLNTKEVYDYFNSKIIGQPQLIERFYNFIKLFKAGLNNPSKPLQVLLFAGPTGVGKTASAKALAQYFFGEQSNDNKLIRIDMSEFKHPSQITELIGGYGETGKLIRSIRMNPFSVLLLDEVEKADPSIFDALMGVFDEGMMSDAYGRTTNFRNTIIIMTSNLGASSTPSIGFSNNTSEVQQYESAIHDYFRPEIVNRLDEIIIFQPLSREAIQQITRKELQQLNNRGGFLNRHIQLTFTDELIDYIVDVGYDPTYGARPIQRAITDIVIKSLSQWLLSHTHLSHTTLKVDYHEGVVIVEQ